MSVAMFFCATDGVLVVADGREVLLEEDGTPVWRADDARKLTSHSAPSPVIGAAVGLAAVGAGDGQRDVLVMLDEILSRVPPSTGVAATCDGRWTAKGVALAAAARADALTDGIRMSSPILGLVVGWPAEDVEPSLWSFDLQPMVGMSASDLDDSDDRGGPKQVLGSGVMHKDWFCSSGFAVVPEKSSVWEVLCPAFDGTVALRAEPELSNVDPRWEGDQFLLRGLSLDELADRVADIVTSAQEDHFDAFRQSQVGGTWVFGYLRPGGPATFETRALGPLGADTRW